jgi:hypothetical protein
MKKTILISAPFGYSIKNLLYSSFWDFNSGKDEIIIISPTPKIYNDYFDKKKIKNAKAFFFPTRKSDLLVDLIFSARRTKCLLKINSETEKIKWKILKQNNPFLFYFKKFIFLFIKIIPDKFIVKSIFIFVSTKNFKKLDLPKINTWLSLAPSFEIELPLAKFFLEKNVKKVALIHSWDNLSSKGPLVTDFDKVLVWGDLMSSDLIDRYKYSGDIFKVGIPQYDFFYKFKNKIKKTKLNQIIYTTGHPASIYKEYEIVEIIAKELLVQLPNFYIIVRVHPNDDIQRYMHLMKKYKNIRCIENPGKKTEINLDKWMPSEKDIFHYLKILSESKVLINIASSTSLDASFLGIPVICVRFDAKNDTSFLKSNKKFYQYEHYKEVVKSRGVYICDNIKELAFVIKAIDIDFDKKDLQKKMISSHDNFLDGNSGLRIRKLL